MTMTMNMNMNMKVNTLISTITFSSLLLFNSQKAQSYPEFISYGYSTCITCHYNSGGNGPLTDYGRGLFASEISARTFYNSKISDEEIAEKNTFLGIKNIPWWIRPGFKSRLLWFQTNPGSSNSSSRMIPMQGDFNSAFHLDENLEKVFVFSMGYYPPFTDRNGKKADPNWISREHYFRWMKSENFILYFGAMDKFYGIRQVDHTSFAKKYVQIGQSDQTHGIAAHWLQSEWDLAAHVFLGHLLQDEDLRQKGFSFMGEKQTSENQRWGISALHSTNKYLQLQRLSLHHRRALSKGSSLLFESGFLNNTYLTYNQSTLGVYGWIENILSLKRGYNLYSGLEFHRENLKTTKDDYRWSMGGLLFPHPGHEMRFGLVNEKKISETQGHEDLWSLQMQWHLSL